MREQAQVVIIGGGIIGCSIAYHLTELGWRDVILIEKGTHQRLNLARRRPRRSASIQP